MKSFLTAGFLFAAIAVSFLPQDLGASGDLRGGGGVGAAVACSPGPSPCRGTNPVACPGGPGCTGNWDECIIGNENSPFSCYGPGGLNDNGGVPTHCVGMNCTMQCSEMCLDAAGNPAGDINVQPPVDILP